MKTYALRGTRKEARAHRGAELSRTVHAMDDSSVSERETKRTNRPLIPRSVHFSIIRVTNGINRRTISIESF